MAAAASGIPTPDMEGWFAECEDTHLWPGQRFCLKVKNFLHREQSTYQDIVLFDSTNHGRVLVLDGVIQLSENDEHAYQEMITHIPIMAHPNPESVLIIGAGDGGVAREVCRHPAVKKVVQCEIDDRVIENCKKYFPDTLSTILVKGDPRYTLTIGDAADFIKDKESQYDVIIVDSSDPNDGPAAVLFKDEFYANLAKALKPGGIVCTQGECMWQNGELIRDVLSKAKRFFPTVDYAYACVPTYPSGQIGFLLCSKSDDAIYARTPKRALTPELTAALKYYTPTMHAAAFMLPKFAESAFGTLRVDSSATPTPRSIAAEAPKAAAEEKPCHSTKEYALYGGVVVLAAALGAAAALFGKKLLKK